MTDAGMQVTRWAGLSPVPWKNGGGVTRELASAPPDARSYDVGWRVSIADITRSGSLLTFPGLDRVITLIDGSPVVLTSENWTHTLERDTPYRFSGDDPVTCRVTPGPSLALNVMTGHGARSEVQVTSSATATRLDPHPGTRLLLVSLVEGLRVVSASGEECTLGRHDLLNAGAATQPVEVGPGRYAVVRLGGHS